jgi:preprotein translocase subunit SecA
VSKSIESAQKKIEGFNFDTRKHVLEYDDVMNAQRSSIYNKRKQILGSKEAMSDEILGMIEKELTEVVNMNLSAEEVDFKQLWATVAALMPFRNEDVKESMDPIELTNHLVQIAEREYKVKKDKLSEQTLGQLERFVYLRAIDQLWQEHLDTMEHLRDSVRLRGYGQRDPLTEFKNEGFQLFERLQNEINKAVVYTIYKVDVVQQPTVNLNVPENKEIGRNDPCPCGSGKKWKKCGLFNTKEHQQLMAKLAQKSGLPFGRPRSSFPHALDDS